MTAAILGLLFLSFNAGRTQAQRPALQSTRPSDPVLSSAQIQTLRNIGKAYYEQGHYHKAAAEFLKIIGAGKALATDHLDLGMSLMQAGEYNAALGELTTAREMAPDLLAAHFNLGILYKRELHYPEAERELREVAEKNPSDPSSWFNLGDVYFDEAESAVTPAQKNTKLEAALNADLHVVHLGFTRAQNFYVAALFHCFTIDIRLGHRAEAVKYLAMHQKVHNKVPGLSVQATALESGKYGAIIVPATAPAMPEAYAASEELSFVPVPPGVSLAESRSALATGRSATIRAKDYSLDYARRELLPLFGPCIAVGDYLGNGLPDLYIVNPAGSNHLLRNNGDGTFTDVTAQAGVSGPPDSVSATFADYNNSGHPSLFVVGLGGVHLYRNNGNGTFTDVTAKSGLALPRADFGELDTRAILFDADNDGFLDLLVTGYTNFSHAPKNASFNFPADFPGVAPHFYRNDGDGSFTDITSASGLGGAIGRMRGAAFADFDNNGYLDLVFFRDDGPPLLYLNEGGDRFRNASAAAGPVFSSATAAGGGVADFDHNGNFDLALWTASGYTVLRNDGHAHFTPYAGLPAVKPPRGPLAFRGTIADLEGDGFPGLLLQDSSGRWRFIADLAGHFKELPITLPLALGVRIAALHPTWFSRQAGVDLAGVTEKGQLIAWKRAGPAPHWLEVKLTGEKSNYEGVGDVVEVKAGNFYDKVVARRSPLRIYTDGLSQLDVVRVTWPNGIVENSVNVKTDTVLNVRESERLASSCPFLYVWNGKQYVYFTDVLGASPLGELQPDGTWARANPEEYVRLGSHPKPQNGFYTFQLTSEMREVDFVDRARLLAVDHPAGESLYSNEIYSSNPVHPKIYAVVRKRFPVSAVDDRGHNVLPDLLAVDGRFPTDFRLNRILGLARLHALTLNLGRFRNSDPVALYLTGWVFWTDSNASRALMADPRLKMIMPYLQVRNTAGKWETVIPDMGLPSGTNRTMRVDLTGKFLTSDHHIRIVTNLAVYWDRIFFTTREASVPAPITVPLAAARLHYRGFSTPVTDPDNRKPDFFEYAKLMKEPPWNPLKGNYTRYGDVANLLGHADNRLVVLAPGDDITLQFDARRLPPLKPGWKRDFFLDLVGYAKDGEPNTADSRTVGPMPFLSMTGYPPPSGDHRPSTPAYREYLQHDETRPGYMLLPPLAPAK